MFQKQKNGPQQITLTGAIAPFPLPLAKIEIIIIEIVTSGAIALA